MLELTTLGATFMAILLAEFGDKTQIMTLALAAKSRSMLPVFTGAVLGEVFANTIAVAIGTFLGFAIPVGIVRLVAGGVFILFGVLNIVRREEGKDGKKFKTLNTTSILWSAFYLVALAEMGDKTQLMTVGLSAQYQDPITVLIGLTLAFVILSLIGALLGERTSRIIPLQWIKIGSGILFIVFGILFLADVG
ncbi:MAG: TMEM165/GDT1 family protein [Thaumarchaeota archaeon]|nr:TMEM165/GDT1 family protein [Nitrososphaerota archaeon]